MTLDEAREKALEVTFLGRGLRLSAFFRRKTATPRKKTLGAIREIAIGQLCLTA